MGAAQCIDLRWTIVFIIIGGVFQSWAMVPPPSESSTRSTDSRSKRDVMSESRSACRPQSHQPPNRVDTSDRVQKLRDLMASTRAVRGSAIAAYLIPSDDEHQSEYVAPYDERRRFISGFSGSAGLAIVTRTKAALWTDGRYFLQADDQLDCLWLLMKTGMPGVPTYAEWLGKELRPGDRVGADPKLIGADTWLTWSKELEPYNIYLVPIRDNLVDKIWTKDRPQASQDPIQIHDMKYAGKSWRDKVNELRHELESRKVDMMVVTAMDEVAWLFNLRGSDTPYNPIFRAYAVVTPDDIVLYVNQDKIRPYIRHHLRSDNCTSNSDSKGCVRLSEYNLIFSELPRIARSWTKVLLSSRYSYAGGASYAIYETIPDEKRVIQPSPVLLMKARKNPVEIEGMKYAHIRDAAALCRFLSLLEKEIEEGQEWDEMKAARKLKMFRTSQKDNKGLSFETISAFGPNSAIIHYTPTEKTNSKIDNSSLYLLDSGGQYLDGTTDVTRTMHYGIPTPFQKEMYTRVLMGSIDLATFVFPEGVTDREVDILARRPLYAAGLDYRHGTGHGIGLFLNVHEGPTQVRIYGYEEHKFEEGQFLSDEPGYYKDHEFGIRLENIVRVVKQNFSHNDFGTYFGFEPVTLVPFEPKLIKEDMMTLAQRRWLNQYNALIRIHVGEELKRQKDMTAFHWLMSKTGYVKDTCSSGVSLSSVSYIGQTLFFFLSAIVAKWLSVSV